MNNLAWMGGRRKNCALFNRSANSNTAGNLFQPVQISSWRESIFASFMLNVARFGSKPITSTLDQDQVGRFLAKPPTSGWSALTTVGLASVGRGLGLFDVKVCFISPGVSCKRINYLLYFKTVKLRHIRSPRRRSITALWY
jgi:hypothetical protein